MGAGFAATGKHSALEGECHGSTCPTTAEGDLDSFHPLRMVSTVGYTIGAAALIGGAVLFFVLSPRKTGTATATLHPWVGLGSAGVGGTFQ